MSQTDSNNSSLGLKSRIKNLLGLSSTNPSQSSTNNSQATRNSKRANETYQQYGVRTCGVHSGNLHALTPSLQSVVLAEKQAQANNNALQQTYKAGLLAKKQKETNKKDNLIQQIENHKKEISDIDKEIEDKNEEIVKLKNSKQKDKLTTLTFYISLSIVLLLSAYLFVFYSSASYSAIYMTGEEVADSGLATHIFNPKAIELAYVEGLFALLLILLLPMIFLGLGFLVHQYSTEKGIGKYFKLTILIGVNFIFDAILAYRISKTTYDIWVMSQLAEQPEYSISMAFQSADFWLVIFAGFIAYIIWGLVFSSMMNTYGKLTSNKDLIDALKTEIKKLKTKQGEIKGSINDKRQEISQCDSEIAQLDGSIAKGVQIDYQLIKKCLTDFFSGWLSVLNGLGQTDADKSAAQTCFNNLINSLK